ncbi:galactofuranose ABC transporter, permease protein YjfF [Variovorax sp. YR752]|uniref:galactofuranose ABC transporter, permease protein YjfF n=1 Tax=Variovorax sp. YR752 TaxID=1884383 RepID=UPI00313775AD
MRLDAQTLPSWVAVALFAAMFAGGSFAYTGFFSGQVFLNLLIDNAFLLVVAIGMTFVILSGGIDLSVGSVVALTTMLLAWGVERAQLPPLLLIPLLLAGGALFGTAMGFVIQVFQIPAFIVTLAGMFLARGLCYLVSIDSIPIGEAQLTAWSQARIPVGPLGEVTPGVIVALVVLVLAVWLAHGTAFGRAVYAIGGNERSAQLMGLPVARTRIAVYAVSGLCASLGGVLFGIYTLSGYGLHAQGLELDAIAATVIGGALLSGGVGYVMGTLTGVLMLGVIQTLIMFDGSLSSWWTRIAIGALLGLFCVLQRLMEGAHRRRGEHG